MKKLLCLFGFLVSACGANNLPVYSHLDSLRVLVLLANYPEVGPGDPVVITPYLSDVTGAGRPLTFSASACPDPGIAVGITPSCVGNPLAVTLASSQPVTGLSAANSYTGATGVLNITIPAQILIGQSANNIYNGINYLVTYQVSSSDGTSTSAFRRIIVSQGHTRNSDPSAFQILVGGVALASAPTVASSFSTSTPATDAETYSYIDAVGSTLTATEVLLTSWFSNAGDFQYIRTDFMGANLFTPSASAPIGGRSTFVVVVRDGRGGESIVLQYF